MVLKITNLHILRYLPTYWLYLLERYTIDNQRYTHTASGRDIGREDSVEGRVLRPVHRKSETKCLNDINKETCTGTNHYATNENSRNMRLFSWIIFR